MSQFSHWRSLSFFWKRRKRDYVPKNGKKWQRAPARRTPRCTGAANSLESCLPTGLGAGSREHGFESGARDWFL